MKTIFLLGASLLAWPLFTSCSSHGGHVGVAGYSNSVYGSSHGFSRGFSSYRVGFIGTGFSRWSYDPYRRSYFDHSLNRYYNLSSRSYYKTAPRRFSSPRYPSGRDLVRIITAALQRTVIVAYHEEIVITGRHERLRSAGRLAPLIVVRELDPGHL